MGALPGDPAEPNSEYHHDYPGRQSLSDKVHGTRGKQPRPSAKAPKMCLVTKEVNLLRQPGC